MKSLRDTLQSLFGTTPESTPAVPSFLRDAAAAQPHIPLHYDYPLVPSIDDLPLDPDGTSASPPQPDWAVSGEEWLTDSACRGTTSLDRGAPHVDPASMEGHVAESSPQDYRPKPAEEDIGIRFSKGGRSPESSPTRTVERTPTMKELFSGMATCDPRAFSKRLQQGVREVHDGNPVAFYTAAGISRSAYSRLISHPDRHPSKDTVLAMAAALRMTLPDAENFLRLAGYALSPHIPADLVWRRCFQTGIHDLAFIRKALVARSHDHPC